jgi:hypothetical protein
MPLVRIPGGSLWGALLDDGGLRAVIRNELTTIAVDTIQASGARQEREHEITFQPPHEEDNIWSSFAPYCGP